MKAVSMPELDLKGILTVLVPVFAAAITGLLAFLSGRRKASADSQTTLAGGFQMLVGKMQEERAQLMRVIDDQSEEITALRADVRKLSQQVGQMERLLARNNIRFTPVTDNHG